MNNQTQNSAAITQYLLGSLPDAEAERLDELSVTDQAFADALSVAERDLIDAYVQGELKGSVLEQFKARYLASALRREKVKFAEAFQVYAEKSAFSEANANALPDGKTKQKGAGWSSLRSAFTPRLAFQWGVVTAALLLLMVGGWLVYQNARLRQEALQAQARRSQLLMREQQLQGEFESQRSANATAEQELARLRSERERLEQQLDKAKSGRGTTTPAESSVVSFILAPPVRGAGGVPTVLVPAGTGLVSIRLRLEAIDHAAYRVALIDPAGGRNLWHSGNLKPSSKGEQKTLAISFAANLLRPRNYLLRVTGIPATGAPEVVGDYVFQVRK